MELPASERATGKNPLDRATRVLWLEAGFLPLAVGFPQHGFPLYGGAVINTYMFKEIPMSRSAFGWALQF